MNVYVKWLESTCRIRLLCTVSKVCQWRDYFLTQFTLPVSSSTIVGNSAMVYKCGCAVAGASLVVVIVAVLLVTVLAALLYTSNNN